MDQDPREAAIGSPGNSKPLRGAALLNSLGATATGNWRKHATRLDCAHHRRLPNCIRHCKHSDRRHLFFQAFT